MFDHDFYVYRKDEPNWDKVNVNELPLYAFAFVSDYSKPETWSMPHHWVDNGTVKDDRGTLLDGQMYMHKGAVMLCVEKLFGKNAQKPLNVTNVAIEHILQHRKALLESDIREEYLLREAMVMKQLGYSIEEILDVRKIIKKTEFEIVSKMDAVPKGKPSEIMVVPIVKTDNLHRIVYGVVYAPDIVDAQGHWMTKAEVEKMAWRFARGLQTGHTGIDVMHNGDAGSGVVVETFLARTDEFEEKTLLWKAGSWVLGTQITDPDVWQKVLEGKIGAYSLAGHAEFGDSLKAKPGQRLGRSEGESEIRVA